MENSQDSNQLPTGCAVCGKTENLLRCSGCKVLHYCGRDHQTEHRPKHKSACSGVRRAREVVDKAKQALIDHPDFKNDNPFTNHVGRFWKIMETRPYMMGLSKLTHAIQVIEHTDAVQAELDICMEMLRLCPGDNMGVRGSVPSVMLRLHKDQECYDFIKWWETAANDPKLDFTDHSRFLNIKNADVFEPVDWVSEMPHGDLSHPICLMILKIKLLISLTKLQNTREMMDKVMADKFGGIEAPPDMIKAFLKDGVSNIGSSVIQERDDLMDGKNLSATIDNVKEQVDRLYVIIDCLNPHVWPAMRDPEETLSKNPSNMFKMGSEEEMRIALNQTWNTWVETPGSLEFIAFKIVGKADELA